MPALTISETYQKQGRSIPVGIHMPGHPLEKGLLYNPLNNGDSFELPVGTTVYLNEYNNGVEFVLDCPTIIEVHTAHIAYVWYDKYGDQYYAQPGIAYEDEDGIRRFIILTEDSLRAMGYSIDYQAEGTDY